MNHHLVVILRTLAWTLGGCLLLQTSSFAFAQQSTVQCTFSEEFPLDADGTVFLQHYVNHQEGTYSVRVRNTEGYSWIGIGINYDNDAYMIPSYVVIGRMIEDDLGSISPSVGRYWLVQTGVDGVLPINDPNEHLKTATASFTQEDGETILEFTHDLALLEDGDLYQNITSNSVWIWAIGDDDNDWGSRHRLQGSFTISLADTCIDTSIAATMEPNENDTLPVELTPWESSTTRPTSTTSTATITPSGDPNVSIVSNKSVTQVSHGLWVAHGLFMGFAWGLCAPLAIGASYFRNFKFLDKNALWFKLHMYLNATVAFLTFLGFFLAVRATNKEGGRFGTATHHNVGLTIFFFVFLQCAMGYYRPNKEATTKATEKDNDDEAESNAKEGGNNSKDESTVADVEQESFEKPGIGSTWAAFGEEEGIELDITAITQNAETQRAMHADTLNDTDSWSLFTPVPPTPIEDGEGQEMKPNDVATKKSGLVKKAQEKMWPSSSSTVSATSEQESLSDEDAIRICWKIVHRIMGVILLCMAWYNCHSGIVLFSEKYDTNDERGLLNVFWGFAATFAVVFLVSNYILRAH